MGRKYLTIEREYGSGGTKIARMLSEQTGIPCYGSEILEEVSKQKGIPVEKIQNYEETVTNSFLYSIYMMAQTTSGNFDMQTTSGQIYLAEQAVIRRFAGNGSAIFLGHCASEALKECGEVIRVFIRCGDEEVKKQRILEDYGIPEGRMEEVRRRFDKKRANYYAVNTAGKWNDPTNYDLILDSGKLSMDGCVKILHAILN